MKKKKLNIPVGDVKIDPSYDQNVSPDFIIPQSYVRYTKKIGDEEDSTIDYCLEQDDFVSLFIIIIIILFKFNLFIND